MLLLYRGRTVVQIHLVVKVQGLKLGTSRLQVQCPEHWVLLSTKICKIVAFMLKVQDKLVTFDLIFLYDLNSLTKSLLQPKGLWFDYV